MNKFLIIFGLLLVSGCDMAPKATIETGGFNVELLFTVDGCSAYRFKDNGRFVYYTNCPGTTQSAYKTGKNWHRQSTQTMIED